MTEHRNIPARIAQKDAANECALFTPRRPSSVNAFGAEDESGSSARAFDDLFK
jgi:hypothetical protein